MNYTQSIGNVVELQCISKFIEMGFQCSIPYGNSAKYDFIADLGNGELIRIQCKSSTWERKTRDEKNAFSFSCTTCTTNTKTTVTHPYTVEQIDYFATFFNNQVYLVPVEECSTSKVLRLVPPKNGNKNYCKAEDYTIEKVLSHLQSDKFKSDMENREQQINSVYTLPQYFCPECGNPVSYRGNLCCDCAHKKSRLVKRPDRETLKMLIRTTPFTTIGKQFGVSDNAVRKWCDAEKLPRKSREIKKYSDEEWANL